MTRKTALFGSFTVLLLLGATIVHADTIDVTTDRVFENSGGSLMLDLDGTSFVANAGGSADLGMLPGTLTAGEQINLSHTFNTTFTAPFEFGGPHALVNGTTYGDVDLQATNFSFQSSSLTLAPGESSSPFSFTGTLTGYMPGQPANTLFTEDLVGSGTANIMTHATGAGTLALDSISYNFAPGSVESSAVSPTPEPEPLVLLAFGMIGLAVAWRVRHASARP
jgi:hypothetical protein